MYACLHSTGALYSNCRCWSARLTKADEVSGSFVQLPLCCVPCVAAGRNDAALEGLPEWLQILLLKIGVQRLANPCTKMTFDPYPSN
jgi:hypothetical protein